MIVEFSPAAEADLEEIGDFIARACPRRAIDFVRGIRARCMDLGATPYAAPARDFVLPGVRMAMHGNYLIFYRVLCDVLRIERVLHGARDIEQLLNRP